MSKRRNRHHSLSSVLSRADSNLQNKSKPIFGSNTATSFCIPKSSFGKKGTIDLTEFKKGKIFNKNISFFRDNFNQNDTSQLPFMSSLRQNKSIEHEYVYFQGSFSKTTQSRPFSVSMKRTMNQQTSKRIFDITAKQSRISLAYYRWHNKTGKSTTNCMQFECSLRDYNMGMNPEQLGFCTKVKPIKYQDVEPKIFEQSQIICPKQKRLFRLKGK